MTRSLVELEAWHERELDRMAEGWPEEKDKKPEPTDMDDDSDDFISDMALTNGKENKEAGEDYEAEKTSSGL